jgi:hypothetical protein
LQRSVQEVVVKIYSYVVDHDNGYGPNPYFGYCTLCRCKFDERRRKKNIVELAKEGDWVIGTGGANLRQSAGGGKLVYAMRVDERLSREKYYNDLRFAQKKPLKTGTYEQTRGDNEPPLDDFEKRKQFALVSHYFYYFGARAIPIPPGEFPDLEKKCQGFKSCFDAEYIRRFVAWLEKDRTPGKYGDPCYQELADKPKGSKRCKSSC